MNAIVLSHLYYDTIEELLPLSEQKELTIGNNFFFNLNADSEFNNTIRSTLKKTFPNSPITVSTNKGKDIGGKLVLIDLCLKLNLKADVYLVLHDKQSPHTTLGIRWRQKLFRIIDPQNIQKITRLFEKDKKIGIICAKEFILNEYNSRTDTFNCTSNLILKELIEKYKLQLKNYDFVGGTMFWIRAEIINSFFEKYSPLEVRMNLEKGNVMDNKHGTIAHAWERMLSWIATDQGYYIKGI